MRARARCARGLAFLVRQVAQISKPEFSLVVAFLLSFSKSSSFGDREIFHGWRKPACCCPPTGWRAYCLDTPAGCKVGRAVGCAFALPTTLTKSTPVSARPAPRDPQVPAARERAPGRA